MRPVTVSGSVQRSIPAGTGWSDVSPGTDVTQLSAWARVRGQVGFTPLYLFAGGGGRLLGGGQILGSLPVLGRVGYLAYRPLVAADAPDPVAVRAALVGALERIGRPMVSGLFVQPPEDAFLVSADLLAPGFRRSAAASGEKAWS